jgi:hypothetical protein
VTERRGDWVRRVDEHGEFASWFRDQVTTGPYRPSWKVHHAGIGEPWTASCTVELVPGWRFRFDYTLEDGTIQCMGGAFEGDGDPSVLYRKLGGRELDQQIADEFCQDMVRLMLPPDWQDAVLRKRRSGRRPVTEFELAEVAEAYCRACEDEPGRPMPLLASREGLSISALQGLKRKAVNRGLLVLDGHGKAGGRLTTKALHVLEERNSR